MRIHRASRTAVDFVALNLRPDDLEEVMALRLDGDLLAEVREKTEQPGAMVYAFSTDKGEPVMICGFLPGPAPWILNSFLMATDQLPVIGMQVAKAGLKMHRTLIAAGVRRFQTTVQLRGGNRREETAQRFLEFLGYRVEGILRAFGPQGQDYLGMSRIAP